MRKALAICLVVAGLALVTTGFPAAARAADVTVTFTIPTILELTITGSPVAFGTVTPGVATAPQSVNVNVKSNVYYDLTYTTTDFTSGTNTVPIGRLTYSGTTFLASGSIDSNHAPTTSSGLDHTYDYVLTVLWSDAAAAGYTGTVTYTLAAH